MSRVLNVVVKIHRMDHGPQKTVMFPVPDNLLDEHGRWRWNPRELKEIADKLIRAFSQAYRELMGYEGGEVIGKQLGVEELDERREDELGDEGKGNGE